MRRGRAHEDVVLHGVVEDERILEHRGGQLGQALGRDVPQVDAAERDAALLRVEEAQAERREGGLPAARRAHEAHDGARGNAEGAVFHGVLLPVVGERDVFERQIERRGLDRVLGLRELGLGQHLVDARD